MDPDGILNGSKIKERMIRTKNNTGKKAYEYSRIVLLRLLLDLF